NHSQRSYRVMSTSTSTRTKTPRSFERGMMKFSVAVRSERNLSTELDNAPGEETVGHSEVGSAKTQAYVLNLRMVKGVKGFQPQFEMAAAFFAEHEVFEERQVPVITPRAIET